MFSRSEPRVVAAVAALALVACGGSPSRGASPASPPPTSTSSPPVSTASPPACPAEGVAVRVLGSGGPIIDDERASSGYLLMIDGRPRLLVDAGGGVAVRMAEVGARAESLGAILLTHLHVDHTADLIALLKSASFSERAEPLPVVGPTGGDGFPSTREYLHALLGPEGAWRYLGGLLEEEGQPFTLAIDEVDVTGDARSLEVDGLSVRAVGVPHDPVPALGYVIEVDGRRVAFTGDQRLDDPRFLEIAHHADLLIAHHAIPEGGAGMANDLHATPSQIGRFASEAGVGHLVLSHHMQRALSRLDEGLAAVRSHYDGPVEVASDLDCYAVGAR